MKNRGKEWIWISDEYQEYPREEDGRMRFTIYADDESICELTFEELLQIRNMINRIERRHKEKEGGAR